MGTCSIERANLHCRPHTGNETLPAQYLSNVSQSEEFCLMEVLRINWISKVEPLSQAHKSDCPAHKWLLLGLNSDTVLHERKPEYRSVHERKRLIYIFIFIDLI